MTRSEAQKKRFSNPSERAKVSAYWADTEFRSKICRAMSKGHKGTTKSEEVKEKIRLNSRGKHGARETCPKCGMIGGQSPMIS